MGRPNSRSERRHPRYHAQYRFSHADHEDVEVAVRIKISGGRPSEMEVKDLTPPASDPAETVTLSADGVDFVGTSSGAAGGSYRVMLAVGACCGSIHFRPTAHPGAIFVGTKSKDLTATEWEGLQSTSTAPVGNEATTVEHFHAKYVFTHSDYEDVEVAVRITHMASVLSRIEVKDLTPTEANEPVETVALSVDGVNKFGGWNWNRNGEYYRVTLTHLRTCCSTIYFWPPPASSQVYLTGTKSEDLTAAQWAELSGQPAAGGQPQGEGANIVAPPFTF